MRTQFNRSKKSGVDLLYPRVEDGFWVSGYYLIMNALGEITSLFGRFEVIPDRTMLMTDFENSRIVTFKL